MGGKTQTHGAEAENHSVCHQGSAVLIGEAGDGRNRGHDLFDRQREANQSDRVQKKGGQEQKKVIVFRTQFSGEVGGSEIGAGVVKRV